VRRDTALSDPTHVTESERRLRATVRVVLSRGVWAIIAAQLGLMLLWRHAVSADSNSDSSALLLLATALGGFLYLTAGVSRALADRRDVVGLRDALRAGVGCYGQFLWMIAKLVLLTGAVLNVLIYLIGTDSSSPAGEVSVRVSGLLPLVQGILSFVFVYWLPIVFVRGEFALFKTLRTALVMAWRRLSHAGFLAFLTLTPAVVAVAVGEVTPFVAILLINLVGGVMEWVAYAYCVGCLQDQAGG
jgi:hypothetical protein